jgi:ATP-dependent DNA helicase RecG
MDSVGDDGERFIANSRIEGTIREMLEDALLFIRRNMRVKTIVDDTGKRADKPEYPINAVREAVLNALMHRDYSIYTEGAPVRILMFNDRLEIWNEGGLYGRLTIDGLGRVHSDTRNQTLVNILEIQKVAENRYSGIPTIRQEMAGFGLPEPIFENRRGNFVVTLKNDYKMQPGEASSPPKSDLTGTETLISYCKQPRTREEIAVFLGKTQYYAMSRFVAPLLEGGKLKLTIPNKPRSRNQKYYSE